MSRTYRYPNRTTGRCRPRLERLETRLALSMSEGPASLATIAGFSVSSFETVAQGELGPNLSVVATDPAPGAVLSQPPATFSVTFDRPLDPNWLMGSDILIENDQAGTWTTVGGMFSPPSEQLDPTGTQLILTPAQPLTPGDYRLVLPTGSMLMGLDGSGINDPGYDQVLGDFTIAQPGVTLAEAQPLTGVGASSSPVSATGTLDLATNPGALALYRFDLTGQDQWRLAAQVASGNAGGKILSTLAVFDANGQLLGTSTLGLPSAPNDTCLFAGLGPGTYYLGVSGVGNLPYQPGGYDPVAGTTGATTRPDAGGPFRLDVVAVPVAGPTQLLGLRLDHADPLAVSPTGMTLTFSGPLNLDSLRGDPCPGITVLGPGGKVEPAVLVNCDESAAQYQFVFEEALAPGRYTVTIPGQGGLTDLAGQTPVAPGGQLATFTVAPAASRAPILNDLGPLYNDVPFNANAPVRIDPGTAETYRFVARTDGMYVFSTATTDPGARLSFQLFGQGAFSPQDVTPPTTPTLYLKAGVYEFQIKNNGMSPVEVTWSIHRKTPWDSLLDNGVGQLPALQLGLVNVTSPSVDPAPANPAQGPTSATTTTTSGVGVVMGPTWASTSTTPVNGATLTTTGAAATGAPAGLLFTLGSTPVGLPSSDAGRVAAVGPGLPGTVALAASGQGLIEGIVYGQSTGDDRAFLWGGSRDDGPPAPGGGPPRTPPAEVAPVNGAMVNTPVARPAQADELVIAAADWITRFGRSAFRMSSQPDEPPDAEAFPTEAPVESLASGAVALRGAGHVEQAHFDAPVVVGMMSAVALRYHQPMVGWLRRRHALPATRRAPVSALPIRGPHRKG